MGVACMAHMGWQRYWAVVVKSEENAWKIYTHMGG